MGMLGEIAVENSMSSLSKQLVEASKDIRSPDELDMLLRFHDMLLDEMFTTPGWWRENRALIQNRGIGDYQI